MPIAYVFMGGFVISSLALVWWLILKMFSKYNEVRRNRLREIENIFNINNTDLVKQYKLHYTPWHTLRYMSPWGKLVDWIKHRKCLFSWDDVPGTDSERLKRCLKYDYDIGWAKSAEIRKSGDSKTIFISVADKIPAEIMIDETGEKATLKISDDRTRSLCVKKENGKVNIYKCLNKNYREIKINLGRTYDLILLVIFATNIFLLLYSIYRNVIYL